MALLEVEQVTKIYGRRKVVNGVSLSVDRGEIVGLLGRNGAGKTTTFRMVIGLIAPESGSIRFEGQDVTRLPIYKRARLGMGFLPQEPSVFQRLSVEENLLAILETTKISKAEREEQASSMLKEYGLAHLGGQKAYTLSGGEMRRLEICRAMLTSPSIVLLDEPFSGVDPDCRGGTPRIHPQAQGKEYWSPFDGSQRSRNSGDYRTFPYNRRRYGSPQWDPR